MDHVLPMRRLLTRQRLAVRYGLSGRSASERAPCLCLVSVRQRLVGHPRLVRACGASYCQVDRLLMITCPRREFSASNSGRPVVAPGFDSHSVTQSRYSSQRPAVGRGGVAATGRRREPSSDSAARSTVARGFDLFVIKRAPAADRSAGVGGRDTSTRGSGADGLLPTATFMA